ncbi:acyltransferase [Donghicola sp. C2-DW-16]|uniref:Acyltransferase n=1 Tax=Donghicola mangrovi TaxID=2729614 RepID=A0ABX2PG04_9RHOB|nr:acyltransferase family protein [Donghicola mangrovi]NVO28004.1 acyltransferase [Donghicola mangrovi]
MKTPYRADIDGLRALAVMPVVLGHAGIPGFEGGFVGVDVFFVISGYLISTILMSELREGRLSLFSFYSRRAKRLLPALFTAITASLLMGWVIMTPTDFEQFGQSVLAVLALGSNVWMWQNTGDYFGAAAEITPMLHTWSLSVEEQFYLIFPCFFALLYRFSPKLIWLIVALGTALAFWGSQWFTQTHPTAGFYLMPTRVWEFGFGALVAVIPWPRVSALTGAFFTLAGITLIAYAVCTFSAETRMPGVAALAPVLGATWVIFGGRQVNRVSRLLGTSIPVAIGLLSYSLYLWHWPVQVAFRLTSGYFELPIELGIASILLSFFLAYVTRHLIEEPMRKEKLWPVSVATITPWCIGIVCLSVVITREHGIPQRINQQVLETYQTAVLPSTVHEACMDRPMNDGPCLIGGSTGQRVFFWGDSHAGALLPAMDDWGHQTGMRIEAVAKAGCPPILGIDRSDRPSGFGCSANNSSVIKWLRQSNAPETVVLHARWPLVLTGKRSEGEAGGPQKFSNAGVGEADVLASLASTLSQLQMMQKRVVILGPVPEIGLDVPRAFLARERLGFKLTNRPPSSGSLERVKYAERNLRELAQRFGTEFIELSQSVTSIRASDKTGGLLYADDDHLSVLAAHDHVLPVLLREMDPLLDDRVKLAMQSAQ